MVGKLSLEVTVNSNNVQVSNYGNNSFKITNLGDRDIALIDLADKLISFDESSINRCAGVSCKTL